MKNPAAAAVCSVLIMGLGQVYNGQVGKGLSLFLGVAGACLFFLYRVIVPAMDGGDSEQVFGLLPGVLLLQLIVLVVWLWNIYDACSTAVEINRTGIRPGRGRARYRRRTRRNPRRR